MAPRNPSLFDRARSYVTENAARVPLVGQRLAAAMPFSNQPQGPAKIPPASYQTDQPIAPADPPQFLLGFHDHTFQNTSAPSYFGGRTIEISRQDIESHDSGSSFLGSSILAVAMTRFPPVFSALGIRIAPAIALDRIVLGGGRGLARVVREDVTAQLAPRMGLLPSITFPSTLWAMIAVDLAMMGFAVLQHVYGPQDVAGRRRIYTRYWPTWAVYYQPYRKTYIALTNAGPVDIVNGGGKFTIIGKTPTPHLQGAIRALALPVLDGVQVIQARAQWIDRYSDPKLVGVMPPDIAARSDVGRALFAALREIRGPGGFGVVPNGTELEWTGLDDKASKAFGDALKSDTAFVSSVLTGIDTTADGGVYKPLTFWGILHSTVGDDLAATNRGINQGHVYPYTRFNFEAAIEEDEARGTWVDPVLDTPLPDPEADARHEAAGKKQQAYYAAVEKERAVGGDVTPERVADLATLHGASPMTLAEAARRPIDLAPTDIAKWFVGREIRDSRGYPPFGTPEKPDPRDDMTGPQLDALAKAEADAAAAKAQASADIAVGRAAVDAAPREDAAGEQPAVEEATS